MSELETIMSKIVYTYAKTLEGICILHFDIADSIYYPPMLLFSYMCFKLFIITLSIVGVPLMSQMQNYLLVGVAS
jgi:hypothetical protein